MKHLLLLLLLLLALSLLFVASSIFVSAQTTTTTTDTSTTTTTTTSGASTTTTAATTTTSGTSTTTTATTATTSNATSGNATSSTTTTTSTTSGAASTTTTSSNATSPNVTITTTTMLPSSSGLAATTVAAAPGTPMGGPVDTRPIRNVTCPFSRWQGEPRYCYECRWCPFRQSTCCEMEDEIATLKSVNVSGSTDWDCFITIVHFQQCGRCDPKARSYLMNKTLNYVWDPRGVAIRPCKQACKYIYKQCKDAKTLAGAAVVPAGMTETDFCQDYPEINTEALPCFESAGAVSYFAVVVLMIFGIILALGGF